MSVRDEFAACLIGFPVDRASVSVIKIVEFLPDHLAAVSNLFSWMLAVCAAVLLALWVSRSSGE